MGRRAAVIWIMSGLSAAAVALPPSIAPAVDPAIRTAAVGDALLDEPGATIPGIRLDAPVNIANRKLSPGFYPQITADDRYTWHAFRKGPNADGYGWLGGFADARRMRVDKDRRRICLIVPLTIPTMKLTLCDTDHAFARTERPDPLGRAGRRLIYAGRAGGLIRLAYREGDAPTVEVTYDAALPSTIRFKTAQIELIAADAGTLRYRILGGWDSTPVE